MSEARSTDHLARAQAKVFGFLKSKPKLAAVLASWIRRAQDLESASWEVGDYRYDFDLAFGEGLDALGALLLLARGGRTDAQYRIRLRAWLRALRSIGRDLDLIEVGKIAAAGSSWHVESYPPKSAIIACDSELPPEAVELAEVFAQARPIGTRFYFSGVQVAPASAFAWAGSGLDAVASWSGDGIDGGPLGFALEVI